VAWRLLGSAIASGDLSINQQSSACQQKQLLFSLLLDVAVWCYVVAAWLLDVARSCYVVAVWRYVVAWHLLDVAAWLLRCGVAWLQRSKGY